MADEFGLGLALADRAGAVAAQARRVQEVVCQFVPGDEPEPDAEQFRAEGDNRPVSAEEIHPRCDHRRALYFNLEVSAQGLEIVPRERALIPADA